MSGRQNNTVSQPLTIVHPIFLRCMEYTSDSYWLGYLQLAATDKFPKGVRYAEGALIFKEKNKDKINKVIIPPDPSSAFIAFTSFMRTLGHCSDEDEKLCTRVNQEKVQEDVNSWSSVKGSRKSQYIHIFLDYVKTTYNLTDVQVKSLKSAIDVGILFKVLNKDNIIVQGGAIRRIDGVIFNNEKQLFELEPSLMSYVINCTNGRFKDEPVPQLHINNSDRLNDEKIITNISKDYMKLAMSNNTLTKEFPYSMFNEVPQQSSPFLLVD